MAAIRGWIQGDDRSIVTRNAHRQMTVGVYTWNGKANLTVDKDGSARLTVENDHHGPREVWAGNIEQPIAESHRKELAEALGDAREYLLTHRHIKDVDEADSILAGLILSLAPTEGTQE